MLVFAINTLLYLNYCKSKIIQKDKVRYKEGKSMVHKLSIQNFQYINSVLSRTKSNINDSLLLIVALGEYVSSSDLSPDDLSSRGCVSSRLLFLKHCLSFNLE